MKIDFLRHEKIVLRKIIDHIRDNKELREEISRICEHNVGESLMLMLENIKWRIADRGGPGVRGPGPKSLKNVVQLYNLGEGVNWMVHDSSGNPMSKSCWMPMANEKRAKENMKETVEKLQKFLDLDGKEETEEF